MAFARKILRLTFTLWQGNFAGSGTNTLTVSGLRTQCRINTAGAPSGSKLSLAVYGLTLSQMNDLSTLGIKYFTQAVTPNSITVEASSDGGQSFSTVYIGEIYNAFADLQGMPDAPLRVDTNSTGLANVATANPSTINGSVAPILGTLAQTAGLTLDNSANVNAPARNFYLYGSAMDQIREICNAYNIGCAVEKKTLIIWQKGSYRAQSNIPIVSSATGLVGFPSFADGGLILKTLFNPAIEFAGLIQVFSSLLASIGAERLATVDLPPNGGNYFVTELDHQLDSWVPNGQWFSTIYATNPSLAGVVQQGGAPG